MNTTTPSPAPLSEKDLRVRLGFVEIPEMDGDNIAVLLCSHFENPEQDQDDEHGWTPDAISGCNKTLDAIHALYLATLTAKDEIIAGLTADRDDAQESLDACRNQITLQMARVETAKAQRDAAQKQADVNIRLRKSLGPSLERCSHDRVLLVRFCEKVRDTAVGKDDALDVCVDLMKVANALLCSLSPPTQVAPKEGT